MADDFKLRLQTAHARRMKDAEEKQAIAAAAQRAASMLSAAELQALDALEPAARTRLDAAASVDPQRYTVQVDVDREARTVAVNLSNLQSSKNLVPATKADKFAIATLESLLEEFVGGGLR